MSRCALATATHYLLSSGEGSSLAVSFSCYNIAKKQFAVATMLLTNSQGHALVNGSHTRYVCVSA